MGSTNIIIILVTLITIRQAPHSTHNAQHIVVNRVHTYLCRAGSLNGSIGQNQLERGVVNAREVAGTRRLMLFRSQGEGIDVDSRVRGTGVVLVRLHLVEVGTFTLREPILTVKLQLGSNDGVLSPAVHVQRSLSEDKGAGIRDTGRGTIGKTGVSTVGNATTPYTVSTSGNINGSGVSKEPRTIDKITSNRRGLATERHNGVGEGINTVSVVEGLGTESTVQDGAAGEGRTVVDIGIRLHHEDQLLAGVVEVELDFVAGRTDGFITRKLELLNEVFVGVLRHPATLIRVEEDVVDIQGGGNEGLVVGIGTSLADTVGASQVADSPEALINGADVKVNLDFVVLKSNEGERKPGVAAVPELEGDIEGGFGEGIAGLADLGGCRGSAGTINAGERGIRDKGKLGGVTNHLEVTTFLLLGEGKLVPQMHPVTILSVNALTSNFDLNLRNHLLSGEIEPSSPDSLVRRTSHLLVDFGESYLQVSAVSQITVTADSARDTATKVSLPVEGLFNGFHGEVGVATVSHLPKSNLRITRKVNILSTVGHELH